MATARDIVTSALKRIRVVGIGSGEDVPGEIAEYVLGELNDLMHSWATLGVDVKHSDLGISDTFWFPVPPKGIDSDTIDAMESQGNWNASTNTPTLTSATGTQGQYYRVTVAGSTHLDDVTSWSDDDVAIFDGTAWLKGQSSRKHEGAIADMLALNVADHFGKDVGDQLRMRAADGWTALQADFIVPGAAQFDQGLVRTTTRRFWGSY